MSTLIHHVPPSGGRVHVCVYTNTTCASHQEGECVSTINTTCALHQEGECVSTPIQHVPSIRRGAQTIFLGSDQKRLDWTSHLHVRPPDLENSLKNSSFHKHSNDLFYFNIAPNIVKLQSILCATPPRVCGGFLKTISPNFSCPRVKICFVSFMQH